MLISDYFPLSKNIRWVIEPGNPRSRVPFKNFRCFDRTRDNFFLNQAAWISSLVIRFIFEQRIWTRREMFHARINHRKYARSNGEYFKFLLSNIPFTVNFKWIDIQKAHYDQNIRAKICLNGHILSLYLNLSNSINLSVH